VVESAPSPRSESDVEILGADPDELAVLSTARVLAGVLLPWPPATAVEELNDIGHDAHGLPMPTRLPLRVYRATLSAGAP